MSITTLARELRKFGGVSLLALGLFACAQTPQRADQSSPSKPSAQSSDDIAADRYVVTIAPANLWEKLGEDFGLSPATGSAQASTGLAPVGRRLKTT